MSQTRRELIQEFLPNSPFVGHLGIRLRALERDRAELALPFGHEVITIEQVVHGGAIASLIDTAAMVAAWSDDEVPQALRGSTVALSIDYVAPAMATDLLATAVVVRRGTSLCFLEVTVTDSDGRVVAKGLATYRFG